MELLNTKEVPTYFFILCFLILTYLSYLLIKPFLTALIGSIILAYLFYPLYKKSPFKNKNLSSLVTCLAAFIIIILPLAIITPIIIFESVKLFNSLKETPLNNLYPGISPYLTDLISKSVSFVLSKIPTISLSFSFVILNFFVLFFIMFFLLKDGEKLLDYFKDIIPLKKEHKKELIEEFKKVTKATIFGLLVVGLIQGVAGGLGLFIFGFPNALLWSLIMVILAILPFVGPAFILVPAGLIAIFKGNLFAGIGIIVYALIVVSLLDNLLKPKIIGKKAAVHPALILIGVLGGLKVFGIIGVIIGPLILALFFIFLKIYKSNKR